MKKPNILFIVLDALRAENLGCYGYSRNTSPNIDGLSRRGVLFKNAFSTNNATDKSIMAILSGRHIPLRGERDIFLTREEIASFFNSGGKFLQEILGSEGYKTYRLNELWGWQKRGFDFYYQSESPERKTLKKLIKNFLRDSARKIVHLFPKNYSDKIKAKYGRTNGEKNTRTAIKIIEESEKEKPFFMWIDYNDTHIPYNPKDFTNKFQAKKGGRNFFKALKGVNYRKDILKFWRGAFGKNSTFEDIIARYDSAIYHDDFFVGKVLEALKKKGILDNTLIFLFSDHGESFTTQGVYFNHHGLYDVCTRVPLIVSGPGILQGKVNSSFVHHEDFIPTILDILQIKYNPKDFDGMNLFNKKNFRKHIFMEESSTMGKRAIRDNKYKYIEAFSRESAVCSACNQIHGGIVELYDLRKDPEEKINIVRDNKKKVVEMKSLLENHLRELRRINGKRKIKHLVKGIKLKN